MKAFRDKHGTWLVQPVVGGRRPTIRFGRVTRRQAETMAGHVEHLVNALSSGQPLPAAVASWLGEVDDVLHDRLVRAGLVAPRAAAIVVPTLGDMVEAYIDRRTDVTWRTRDNYHQAGRALCEFFGEGRQLSEITAGDADDFKRWLLNRGATATAAQRIKKCKLFFADAVKRGYLGRSPIADVRAPSDANPDRLVYVPLADVVRVVEATADPVWRALLVLAREAGLRVPSEPAALRWDDVAWDVQRFTVRATKTKNTRLVPLFPLVEQALVALFERAEPGEVMVFPHLGSSSNLRTQLGRLQARAGVQPWGKPFQNLRASAETDLVQRFPAHVACGWVGNSPKVAARHYLQVTDQHFDQAVQKPVHEPVQHPQAPTGTGEKVKPACVAGTPILRDGAAACGALPASEVPPAGLEPALERF